ncbi:MAG: BolA family protein [Gammaproteobacteria bacterium]
MIDCTPEQVRDWLAAGLGAVEVLEVEGDGRHFRALVVSDAFEGLSRVRRHQLIYAALKGRMEEDIHALSLRLLSPGEYHAQT